MVKKPNSIAKGVYLSALLAASHKLYTRDFRRKMLKKDDCFVQIMRDLQELGKMGGML